ncbi:MAG: hypothetical protein HYS27_01020 [Deltaproteobacteria bacterium]|nr:hypothetical protein [Deltaproteobacteria bacterium]
MSLIGLTVRALSTSTPALTSNVRLCFKAAVVYDDAARNDLDDGTIEDNWASGSSQTLFGSRIIATSGGVAVPFDTHLGDGLGTGDPGSGCTASVPVTHSGQFFSVSYTVYSKGIIQGNELYVQNADSGNSYASFPGTLYYSCAGGGCNLATTVTIAPSGAMPIAMWQVYAADAYSLFRHAGGLTSSIFTVRLSNDPNYDSEYNRGTGIISIRQVDAKERFTDSHELGHRIAHLRGLPTGDCALDDAQCPSISGSHSMGSEEHQSCSFSEGFAHFYAADVWNSHYQQDCVFQYYKYTSLPAVDCEASPNDLSDPVSFPLAMLENTCGSGINDHGVEVDWLRTFWDVHTNGSSPPTFNDMMNWMQSAFFINLTPPFDELDGEANAVGGTLNQNWDAAADGNGINH